MPSYLREYWKYLIGALLLHVLIAALFTVTVSSMSRHVAPQQLAIQATVVDQSAIKRAQDKVRQAEEERRAQEEAAKQAQEDAAKRTADAEAQQRQKEQEEKQEQVKRQQQEAEKQRQAETEREHQAAEQQARAETERRQRAEAEKQRVADIERKQRDEIAKRQAAEEARQRAERETELRRQLAEEEGRNTAANSGLLNQYVAMIEQRVVRNWNRPPSARPGLECEVKVTQAPGGTVLTVQVGRCNGDTAVTQSIEAAVYRSSPLPPPPDPRLFERVLVLVFKPAE